MKKGSHQIIFLVFMTLHITISFTFAQVAERPMERITFSPDDTQRCLRCHGMANFAFRDSATLAIHNYSVDADSFKGSVHGKLNCQQCHADIKEYPHTFMKTRMKVSCGNDCHSRDDKGIAYTHQSVVRDFQESSHRRGLDDSSSGSPTCVTCHGRPDSHQIAKAQRTLTSSAKIALCTSCHEKKEVMAKHKVNPDAVVSYKRSFHYKAIRFGVTTTAVCQDCHTTHHIMPLDSTKSSIAAGNIANTCGQEKCHPGAKMNFAMSGASHLDLRIKREPILKFEEQLFILLTLGTMVMLVVGIMLDIQKKFGWLEVMVRLTKWTWRKMVPVFEARVTVYTFMRKILID